MTVIGRTTLEPIAALPHPPASASLGSRFDAFCAAFFDALMKSLCRASRGYLCPPDMTSVMYPDDPVQASSLTKKQTDSQATRCCDENLPGN